MSNNDQSLAQAMKEESEEKAKDAAEETKVEEGLKKKEDTDPETGTEGGDGGGGDDGSVSGFLMSKKEEKWCRALLGVRISAFVLCLISFTVMAADKVEGVVIESMDLFGNFFSTEEPYSFRWYDYKEFKYSLAVNVIGFVYSGLQICDLVKYLITKKHTLNLRIRGYFSVAMDQGFAYLLMSASSSAASTIHISRSYWVGEGVHKFTDMASASIALSFLAFLAFASASIVSGLMLRFN
ncbi:CASP-like protein N24 [Lotus japonicus]|uniref:CASP-like protein N24 n=1 Tax=Lotus japonicus TaxID=34305 RepID=UPI00258C430F|nr:CASP-like protein N24 [Lotus japonicus]